MENEALVRIVGDASQVAPATDMAKAEVAGLQDAIAELAAIMRESTAQMSTGMKQVQNSTHGAREEMRRLHEESSSGLTGMISKIHEGAESVRTFQMRAKEFAEVYVAMFAVEQVSEFIDQMAEKAEKIEHLAQTFGMATNQVQQLGAIATTTGIPLEALTRGMQILDRNAITAATSTGPMKEAFHAIGISANDGRTQMERLELIADKFKNMDDGPKKVALAMELLGRSGAQLIPILNLGSAGLRQITEKAKEFDVANTAVSQRAEERGVALAESVNESRLAMQGMYNVLTDALAPALKTVVDGTSSLIASLVASYNSGGSVAQAFAVIGNVMEHLEGIIGALTDIFGTLWNAVSQIISDIVGIFTDAFGVKVPNDAKNVDTFFNVLRDSVVVLKDATIVTVSIIAAAIDNLVDHIRFFAKIAEDAFTLNWNAISSDWKTGTDRIAQHAEQAANRIKTAMHEAGAAIAAAVQGKALQLDTEHGLKTSKGGAGGDFNPTLGQGHKKQVDRVQQWQQDLAEMKLDQANWDKDQIAMDVDFWTKKSQLQNLNAKEQLQVRANLNRALLAQMKEQQSEEISAIKASEAIKIDQAKTEIELSKIALQEKLTDIDAEEKAGVISATRAAQVRADLNQQLLALDRDLENREFQIKKGAIDAEIALAHTTQQQKNALRQQEEVLVKQHQDKLALLNAKADQQMIKDDEKVQQARLQGLASLTQSWGQTLAQMATLQSGFLSSMRSMWQAFQQSVSNVLSGIIDQWLKKKLSSLVLSRAADQATSADTIAANAAVAASGAYAATAAIPIVGPELAPAAAASAYAGTMAWMGSLAVPGFDVGAWDLSKDQLAMVHSGEMVIPAGLAGGMRDLFEAVGAGWTLPGEVGGSGRFADAAAKGMHSGPPIIVNINALDQKSGARWLMDNKRHVAASLNEAVRQGYRPK